MTVLESPTPRRVRRPRWLDLRVVGGVVLLAVSVVVGARVIGASSRIEPVWAVAHDLAAGTVLQSDDLVAAEVNLGGRRVAYLSLATPVVGRILNRPLHAGELLAAAAIDVVPATRIVAVPVDPDRIAPGVDHGSIVDLYLVVGRAGGSAADVTTELVHAGATVQSVSAPSSGGLSGAISGAIAVALLLPPAEADALVRRLPTGQPLVVLHVGAEA